MSTARRPSSVQSLENWELSLEELDLLRHSVEALLRGLELSPQVTFSKPSKQISRQEILQRLHRLDEFLNTPSSTYTLTRWFEPYHRDMSTLFSLILEDVDRARERSNSFKSPPERQSSV